MEYSVFVSVVPTEKTDFVQARVSIIGAVDYRYARSTEIYSTVMWSRAPHAESDAQLWALHVLREVVMNLDRTVYSERTPEQAKLMLELFEH